MGVTLQMKVWVCRTDSEKSTNQMKPTFNNRDALRFEMPSDTTALYLIVISLYASVYNMQVFMD